MTAPSPLGPVSSPPGPVPSPLGPPRGTAASSPPGLPKGTAASSPPGAPEGTAARSSPAAGLERLEFSPAARKRIGELYTRYPIREAALLPVLRLAEEEFSGIGPEAIECVAREMGLSPGYVFGVFTFYSHFRRKGEGKYLLQVCATLPCALRGCRELVHHLEEKLGVRAGETTPDGRFTLKKVECLASCDTAPVVQVNDDYHENLTVENLDRLLEALP